MDKIFDCRVNDGEHLAFKTDKHDKAPVVRMCKDTDVFTDYLKEYKIICLDREQVLDLIAFLNECLHELDW